MSARLIQNPRSILHALEPKVVGTEQVESLVSYFCRLAVSHSISVTALAKVVEQATKIDFQAKFDWRAQSLSGIGSSAVQWSGALAAVTSVGHLDLLTLSSLASVLAPKGLMASSTGKWCPHCFKEDRELGKTPYFRLAWDINLVKACARHGTQLVCTCPECGKSGVRHNAAYVIPGWCAHCGAFLGSSTSAILASPEALWVAEQVGRLLAAQASLKSPPRLVEVQQTLVELISRLSDGNSSAFGKRIGVAKSTVHYWVHGKTALTLETALRIAAATGLSLEKLLMADMSGWVAPTEVCQLDLDLEFGSRQRTAVSRHIDWAEVREQLQRFSKELIPISLAEASRRMQIETNYLYLHANQEARILSARWQEYAKRQTAIRYKQARDSVVRICKQLMSEGKCPHMRDVRSMLTKEELASITSLIDLISDVTEELRSDK